MWRANGFLPSSRRCFRARSAFRWPERRSRAMFGRLASTTFASRVSAGHRAVDDTPAGGGPGMVIRADVLGAALDAGLEPLDARPRLLLSPRGQALTQSRARALAAERASC